MDASFTNSRESIVRARRVETDWGSLARAQQIRSIELDGYVVIPSLLSEELLPIIRAELAKLPTTAVDDSEHQRGCSDVQWTDSPHAINVIALPAMIEFLNDLLGDGLICTSCGYAVSEPGHPGIAIHTDSQPYGSKIFGVQASSPCSELLAGWGNTAGRRLSERQPFERRSSLRTLPTQSVIGTSGNRRLETWTKGHYRQEVKNAEPRSKQMNEDFPGLLTISGSELSPHPAEIIIRLVISSAQFLLDITVDAMF